MAEFPDNDTIVSTLENLEEGVREFKEAIGNASIEEIASALEHILNTVNKATESFAVDLDTKSLDNEL